LFYQICTAEVAKVGWSLIARAIVSRSQPLFAVEVQFLCSVVVIGDKGSEIFLVYSEGLHDMRNPEAYSTLGRGHASVL
jgi:hypothetical protein